MAHPNSEPTHHHEQRVTVLRDLHRQAGLPQMMSTRVS